VEISHQRPDELAHFIGRFLVNLVAEWQGDPWEEVFYDDYLYFYAERLAPQPSERGRAMPVCSVAETERCRG